jgi:hypothetical protein
LAQLDDLAVKAIVPLTEGVVQTHDERKLYEALGGLNDLDGGVRAVAGREEAGNLDSADLEHFQVVSLDDTTLTGDQRPNNPSAQSNASIDGSSTLPVMLFSCMAALVAFLGISVALYIVTVMRSRALRASQNTWEMLPRTEKQTNEYNGSDYDSPGEMLPSLFDSRSERQEVLRSLLLDDGVSQSDSQHLLLNAGFDQDIDTPDLITFDDPPAVDGHHSDDEEPDDFYDAYSDPSTPIIEVVPEIVFSCPAEGHSDPPVPSLAVTPPSSMTQLPHSPARKPLQMRELNLSPISRPAWSLRAGEDSSLFIPSPSASSGSLPPSPLVQPLPLAPSDDNLSVAASVPRRRGYRSAVPEFDLALAMQLRPGLGIGADPAWMVRFLMAMFGWFTVLLTGKKERQQRLAA